ncbi:TPR repeat family protein [Rickettsia hoogstraalii str. RCCE3]|nr:TPR repeat family protein [Rickettsia hoogstraalii str. RCCE3]
MSNSNNKLDKNFDKALLCLEEEKYETAIKYFDKVLNQAPSLSSAYSNKAFALK